MSIRSTSKAIVIDDNKILLNKCSDQYNGIYYSLVGGGQNTFEVMTDACKREVLEETGYKVKVDKFVGICELICEDEEFRQKRPDYAHKMYHIFLCSLENKTKSQPTEKDAHQISTEWISLKDIKSIRILPKCVGENLIDMINSDGAKYIGSSFLEHNNA